LPRTGPFQAPDYTSTSRVAIAPRSAFDANEAADTRLCDRHIGNRVEKLLLLARGAVLVAGHSHQGKKPHEADRPSDNSQGDPKQVFHLHLRDGTTYLHRLRIGRAASCRRSRVAGSRY
jgi:hypothetical protein